MSSPGPTIDLAVPTSRPAGAEALHGVADLLEGRELTPAMGRWARRLAATFSSWHDVVVRSLETHPALSLGDPSASAEVPDTYVAAVVTLTRGLGPRVGHGDVVPVAVALVELAGSFDPTFAPLRHSDPALHARLHRSAELTPSPFGSAGGLTNAFVEGVVGLALDITTPGVGAGDVRAAIHRIDVETMNAIGHLRRAGSRVHGVAAPIPTAGFQRARVAALAAVLDADEAFCEATASSTVPVDRASVLAASALDATTDFGPVARTDERIAAGLMVALGDSSAPAGTFA
ncbi:MAG: hypothetical protein AAF480_07250 [Actinomycetota bacterium]